MTINRWDTSGRDVTDLPGLWSEDDIEVCQTNFPHPSITSGMHTNGPATIWVRLPAETGEWRCTGLKHLHKMRECWEYGEVPVRMFPY